MIQYGIGTNETVQYFNSTVNGYFIALLALPIMF